MKGIVLAGAPDPPLSNSKGVSKQLLLSMINQWFIILSVCLCSLVSGYTDYLYPIRSSGFKRLLGDGSDYGVNFQYAEQPSPDGLAQAFIIGEKFMVMILLALFLVTTSSRAGFSALLKESVRTAEEDKKATVFGYWVNDPERYGVAEFDKDGNCLSIEEKPKGQRATML